MVYVAPDSAKEWHRNLQCPGLQNARRIVQMSRPDAERQGYEPFGICTK